MRPVVFIIIFLAGVLNLYSQKIPVSCNYDGQKISYEVYQKFCSSFAENGSDVVSQHGSAVIVTPVLKKGTMKQIEGIEVKKAGKTTLTIKISDKITGRDTMIKRDYDVTGQSEYEIQSGIATEMQEDTKLWNQINAAIVTLFKATDCKVLEAAIKKSEEKEGVSRALQNLLLAQNTFSICMGDLSAYEKQLKQKFNDEICEKSLYDAKIMINSGKEHLTDRAVSILLQIPPDAKCREEALKLSDELFQKNAMNQKSKEKLTRYRKLVNGNGYTQWLELIED